MISSTLKVLSIYGMTSFKAIPTLKFRTSSRSLHDGKFEVTVAGENDHRKGQESPSSTGGALRPRQNTTAASSPPPTASDSQGERPYPAGR